MRNYDVTTLRCKDTEGLTDEQIREGYAWMLDDAVESLLPTLPIDADRDGTAAWLARHSNDEILAVLHRLGRRFDAPVHEVLREEAFRRFRARYETR